MDYLLSFFRLIRLPNLLIIAGTQFLIRWSLLDPLLSAINNNMEATFGAMPIFTLQFKPLYFSLLVLATLFLTAAGYVINDYFDTKTDLVNRPRQVVVGIKIPRRVVMFLHVIFNVTGVAIGFYLAYKVKMPSFGFVFLLVSGILWFYSTTYKRQFLIGNLLVAILTAMVPFMVVLFELPMLNRVYGQVMISYGQNFYLLIYWVLGFSFFAFITTLIREIIKDIEDFEGDRAYGMNTLPVVIGVRWSKAIALALTTLTIGAIIVVYLLYLGDKITLVYLLVMLILPLLVFGVMLIKARETSQFHRASVVLKLIMMTGILYTLVARYNLTVSF